MTTAPVDGAQLLALVRDVADFPSPGIVFKDIGPLLRDPAAYAAAVAALTRAAQAASSGFDVVAGVEARGFLLGAPLALAAGVGFVPIRKAGKLPGATLDAAYSLEYGQATVQVQRDVIREGDRVLLVDDVLATGGTVGAAVDLLERAGGSVVAVAVMIELGFLDGATALRASGYHGPLVSLQTV